VPTLKISAEGSALVDDTDLLIAAIVLVEVAMALHYLLALVFLIERW
jgi:hypothetical protein